VKADHRQHVVVEVAHRLRGLAWSTSEAPMSPEKRIFETGS
jgi:hypothetical protein